MSNKLTVVVLMCVTLGCGKDSENNKVSEAKATTSSVSISGLELVGTWAGPIDSPTETITFSSDGKISSSSKCNTVGFIKNIKLEANPESHNPNFIEMGSGTISITSNNGAGCAPIGEHSCGYVVWSGSFGTALSMACDYSSEAYSYYKQ